MVVQQQLKQILQIKSICYLPYYDEDHIQELTDEVSEKIYDQPTLINKLNHFSIKI